MERRDYGRRVTVLWVFDDYMNMVLIIIIFKMKYVHLFLYFHSKSEQIAFFRDTKRAKTCLTTQLNVAQHAEITLPIFLMFLLKHVIVNRTIVMPQRKSA